MRFKYVKGGLAAVAITGCALIPMQQAEAAEGIKIVSFENEQKDNVFVDVISNMEKMKEMKSKKKEIKIATKEELTFNHYLSEKVFAKTEDGYLLVMEAADENSEWVGKVFDTSVLEVLEKKDGWAKIVSGDVTGYVQVENLIQGLDAVTVGTDLLTKAYPEQDIYSLSEEEIDSAFTVGETREAEAARLKAEEEARIAAEQARIEAEKARIAAEKAAKGQSVVDYALQFVGNPYVWGGTSLTNGADCSGFVLKVFQQFGISLPHSSGAMRGYGYEVSYSEAQAGDIVCYDGHVAIYMGNGAIVHAANEKSGIKVTYNAGYQPIVCIRRLF